MQPICGLHERFGPHRHCPCCQELVTDDDHAYVNHAWLYCRKLI